MQYKLNNIYYIISRKVQACHRPRQSCVQRLNCLYLSDHPLTNEAEEAHLVWFKGKIFISHLFFAVKNAFKTFVLIITYL